MKKKFFSLVLVICMMVNIVGILPVNAGELIVEGTCGESLTWTLDSDGVLTISGEGNIPEYGGTWNSYDEFITKLVVNAGVTEIGYYAFGELYNLTSAEISYTVTSIDEWAFPDDNSLIIKGYTNSEAETFAINYGYTFESMGEMPIAIVTQGVYGENLTYALDNYGTLTISGTGSTPELGDDMWFRFFYEFGENIKHVVINNGITMISYGSFLYCSNVISVTIPESVTIIDEGAFYGCDNLESVEIPYTVTTIGVEAFPTGETFVIKGYKYSEAESFAKENGNTFVSLGDAPCVTLAEGICGENLTWELNNYGTMTISGSGAMTDWDSSYDMPWYDYRKKINSVTLNDGITSIGDYAFYSCELTTVKVPNSVTDIGNCAFSYCENLTSIEIPYTVTYIGYDAFDEGEGLVIKGYKFSEAEEFAAENGNKFESIGEMPVVTVAEGTCGESLTWVFDNYNVLTISGTGKMDEWGWITYEIDENLFMNEFIDAPWYEYEGSIECVMINIGVTSIGDYAFYNCYNLESVEIPYTVTDIDDYAIPTGVLIKGYKYSDAEFFAAENGYTFESIGEAPFAITDGGEFGEALTWELDNRGNLTISGDGKMPDWSGNSDAPWHIYNGRIKHVVINNGVKNISSNAFYYYEQFTNSEREYANLTSVEIAYSVREISSSAFPYEQTLNVIGYTNSMAEIFAEENGHTFESLGDMPVETVAEGVCGENLIWGLNNYGLLEVSGDGEMTNWSSCSDVPWYGWLDDIKTVTINDGVTTIGDWAFYNCDNIATIKLPIGIERIGAYAFKACDNLISIEIPYTVSNIHYDAMGNSNENLVIKGYSPSYIEEYAQWHELAFESMGKTPTIILAEGTCGSELVWNVNNYGTLIISGTGAMYSWNYTDVPWDEYLGDIKNIEINNGVTTIGDWAFYNCKNLVNVEIANSVMSIGECAFNNCDSLTSIKIPVGVKTIGEEAFYHCSSLATVEIAYTVTKIGDDAFGYCDDTLIVSGYTPSIAETYAEEEGLVFESMGEAPSVVIDEGICGETFTHDNYLIWTIDNYGTLTISGTGAMSEWDLTTSVPWSEYAEDVKTIKVNENVTSITNEAFYICENITSVEIHYTVTSIGNAAFPPGKDFVIKGYKYSVAETYAENKYKTFECLGEAPLMTIEKGICGDNLEWQFDNRGNLTILGEGIFGEWTKASDVPWSAYRDEIINIVVDENNKNYCAIDGSLFSGDGTMLIQYATGKEDTEYTIGEEVTSIGNFAFYSCDTLTSVKIPDSVEQIGTMAFAVCGKMNNIEVDANNDYYCTEEGNLFNKDKTVFIQYAIGKKNSEYVVPNSVTIIGEYAFSCAQYLKNIRLSEKLKSIESYAFWWCPSLTEIKIPEEVINIGYYAFGDCDNLLTVEISDGVTTIDDFAFIECANLTSVDFGNGVKEIGDDAFASCESLLAVEIPNSTECIGNGAFSNCESLTSVILGEGVEIIGSRAFQFCEKLKYIEFGNNIKSIGSSLLYGTTYYETNANWEDEVLYINNCLIESRVSPACNIKEGTKTIAEFAFSGHGASIVSITIPESVENIGKMAFGDCTRLENIIVDEGNKNFCSVDGCLFTKDKTEILRYTIGMEREEYVIPDSVTTIRPYAFYRSYNLESVIIPESVTNIEDNAFLWCDTLTDVYYMGNEKTWEEVIVDGDGNEELSNATIHFVVPEIKDSVVTKEGVKTNVTVDLEGTEAGGIIRGVVIDDSIAKEFQSDNAEETVTLEFDNVNKGTIIKIFWWESYESMRPLCEAKVIIIE